MTEPKWWEKKAHQGIIGLAPPPWGTEDYFDWPTQGYDGQLAWAMWDEEASVFERTEHTKAEWLELANEMSARWTAWKAHVEGLPE